MESTPLAETIRAILHEELSHMRGIPSSDLRIIQMAMEDLKNSQAEMKRELSMYLNTDYDVSHFEALHEE